MSPKTVYSYKIRGVVENRETKTKSRFSDPVTVKTTKTLKLPKVSGACKTYAYYDAVTDKTSPAYAVLNSGTYRGVTYKTTTDETTGIRMVGEYYCAALGTFYGTTKGTKYKVTLDTGKTFKIILCDTKSNRHTDKSTSTPRKIRMWWSSMWTAPRSPQGSTAIITAWSRFTAKFSPSSG